jgi:Grx4 family monothiol glutaredoxin
MLGPATIQDVNRVPQVKELSTEEAFGQYIAEFPTSSLLVIYFHAPWAAPCKQMATVLEALASTYPVESPPSTTFVSVNAEDLGTVSEAYDVTAVPYIVLLKGGKPVATIAGSDAAKVRATVEQYAGRSGSSSGFNLPPAQAVSKPSVDAVPAPSLPQNDTNASGSSGTKDLSAVNPGPTAQAITSENSSAEMSKEEVFKRLESLVKAAPVMLFMKGTPSAPQCGFSKQTVNLLRERSIRYGFFNILADDDVRQHLKEYSDWPTYPQLYVDGELVGGLDIVCIPRFAILDMC